MRPKISYIPAERNFCSSIPRAQQISGVLHNLAVVIDYFQNASEKLEKTGLPVGGFEYRYDKNTKRKYISSKGKEIQLYESASGLQSLTPLFVISKYFSEPSLALKDNSISSLSSDQRNQINTIIARKIDEHNLSANFTSIYDLYFSLPQEKQDDFAFLKSCLASYAIYEPKSKDTIHDIQLHPVDKAYEKLLEIDRAVKEIVNACFINIVEEPEQNLYPNSQKAIMEFLLEATNKNDNRLIFTTHSPYILGTLNNCLYAGNLKEKGFSINKIVPKDKCITSSHISSYFIENGKIKNAFDKELGQINHDLNE